MARSSNEQSAFIGGEVSQWAQGRSDQPWYKQAMSVCLNNIPVEEGACTRRPGTEFIIPTRGRTFGWLIGFDGSATCSFAMLFTNDNLQFITQSSVVFDNTVSTITASFEGTVTVSPVQAGWRQGDQVFIVFPDATSALYPYPQDLEVGLRNRLLTIGTVVDDADFVLTGDLGDALNYSWPAGALVGAKIMRVLNLVTPYSGVEVLQNLRAVQIEYESVILSASEPPYVVSVTAEGTLTTDPVFAINPLICKDGPYLDPILAAATYIPDTATLSGTSGTITVTMADSTPFLATDVGRALRVFTQPALYNPSTSYGIGANVTDSSGAWWTSTIASNVGYTPGQAATIAGVQQLPWAPLATGGSWVWGLISVVTSSSEVTVVLDTTIQFMTLQTSNGTTASLIQLGVFSPGASVTPTCGTYIGGRMFLSGAVDNRFDSTISDGIGPANPPNTAIFSPTDPYDNVLDDSGISETLNSKYINPTQWMHPTDQGILMGTLNGEFLVFASETNDPLSATNIDSRMVSKFGSLNIEPIAAGMAIAFVQKFGRKIIEYLADAFTSKFSGRHLNKWNKLITSSGVAQLAYQEEVVPIIWARMLNGLLGGWTYRRFSRFVNEPPDIAAAHRHIHGRQRFFTSMCVVPGKTGLLDRLFTVTNDATPVEDPSAPNVGNYFVEILQPVFEEDEVVLDGWFCDEAPGPGPGLSGYDCGGGNAAGFAPTGGVIGSDSTTANVSNVAPYSGSSPAVGTDLHVALNALEASFLDGNTMLWAPSTDLVGASPSDQTELSVSVWVASEDYPLQAGALFSSPALDATEAVGAGTIVSNILAGPYAVPSMSLAPGCSVVNSCTSVDPTLRITADDKAELQGTGFVWNNVMVSTKSNGDGSITAIVYVNETAIQSNEHVTSPVISDVPQWPFATQLGDQKDCGLSVWTVGGNNVMANGGPIYTEQTTYAYGPGGTLKVPTLSQIIQTLYQTGFPPGNAGSVPAVPNTLGVVAGYSNESGALLAYAQSVAAAAKAQQSVSAKTTVTGGGMGNIPQDQPTGGYGGYRGSVAELLVWKGKYIDWTNATNRACVHHFDSTTETYKPVSVGPSGGGSVLGAPIIYLSGPPNLFNLNRATGKRLIVNGEVIESPLDPP